MHASPPIVDAFGRSVRYVRVSVTDRCDMRCVYCMPAQGVDFVRRAALLSYEEIERLIQALAPAGVRSVRITGGEPLVRADVVELVRRVAAVPGIEDVAMTTNARLLPRYAAALAEAGLRRVNVSLDSLDRGRFAEITRGDHLPEVLAGIEAALAAGLSPVKLNTVVVQGVNDAEVPDIVRYSHERSIVPRFIEVMPMGGHGWYQADRLVPSAKLRERLRADGFEVAATSDPSVPGRGPATYDRVRDTRIAGAPWREVGFISPITEGFCDACNRIRVTSTGTIRACLGWDDTVSLRDLMRGGCSDETLRQAVAASLRGKKEGHAFEANGSGSTGTSMSAVGG